MTDSPGPEQVSGPSITGQALSSAEFVDVANGRQPVITETNLTLIREDALPDDWLATTVDCYSTESDYYELAQYGHTQPLKAQVNSFVAACIATTAAGAVLDVGVGDGHRLERICGLVAQHTGRLPEMYGIELSDRMIFHARRRGVHVVKQDMRDGVPDLGRELDAILFLSGDLGYLMHPTAGPDVRREVLDSAYERLAVGGKVVLELVSRDPRLAENGADVFYFSRMPSLRQGEQAAEVIQGPETWQYIKTFSRPEVIALIGSTRFDPAAASLRYVVRDSADHSRIGTYLDDTEIRPDESYRLLVSLEK